MESQEHYEQLALLISVLGLHWEKRDDVFVAGNMFLYYHAMQARTRDFRGPDFFVVLGTERKVRHSWVVWEEEGRTPDLVVELSSPSTKAEDHGAKKGVYEFLRVGEYLIWDVVTSELCGWVLGGEHYPSYRALEPNAAGRLWSAKLGLEIGPWEGTHRHITRPWLRFFHPGGDALPTPEERATEAQAQATQAKAQAAQAEAQAAQAKAQAAQAEAQAAQAKAQAAQAESQAADFAARLAAYEKRFGPLDR